MWKRIGDVRRRDVEEVLVMLRPVRFASLVFDALNLGPAYTHVLEMAPKRRMSGEEWLTTQRAYAEFGKVSSVTFPAALVSTLATLACVRKRPRSAVLTAIGAAGLASTIAIWARFNEPVNKEVAGWAKDGLPS